jgi:CheY-like chemotaxis protein
MALEVPDKESGDSSRPQAAAKGTNRRDGPGRLPYNLRFPAKQARRRRFVSQGRKHRILVIEDEETVRKNLVRLLELEGYRIEEAANGAEGLAAAMSRKPDLVICDIGMPGLDGFGVLARLRAEPATAGMPFIFLTASTDVQDENTGYKLGANEYVVKPFDTTLLLSLVRQKLSA